MSVVAGRNSTGIGMAVVEGVLRVGAMLAAGAVVAILLGASGLGLTDPRWVPGATEDARLFVNERAWLTAGEAQFASVAAANAELGDISVRTGRALPGSPSQAEVSGPTEVTVTLWNVRSSQRWSWVAVRAIPSLATALALWLLANVVRSVGKGDPFTTKNHRRLIWITGCALITGVIGSWGAALVRLWLLETTDAKSLVSTGTEISFNFLAVVLVLAVITEVWRRGVAMRADLAGLV